MQICMISELWRGSRFRSSILTATPHLKRSRGSSGARGRTELPTRASGIPVGNASRSSTRTARQIPSRGGTSTITGMGRALTSSVTPDRGLFSVSSTCQAMTEWAASPLEPVHPRSRKMRQSGHSPIGRYMAGGSISGRCTRIGANTVFTQPWPLHDLQTRNSLG